MTPPQGTQTMQEERNQFDGRRKLPEDVDNRFKKLFAKYYRPGARDTEKISLSEIKEFFVDELAQAKKAGAEEDSQAEQKFNFIINALHDQLQEADVFRNILMDKAKRQLCYEIIKDIKEKMLIAGLNPANSRPLENRRD